MRSWNRRTGSSAGSMFSGSVSTFRPENIGNAPGQTLGRIASAAMTSVANPITTDTVFGRLTENPTKAARTVTFASLPLTQHTDRHSAPAHHARGSP